MSPPARSRCDRGPVVPVDLPRLARSVVVVGEVDEVGAMELRDALLDRSAGYTRSLRVDLTQVTFLTCFAAGVLAVATRRAGRSGGTVEIVVARGSVVHRVLDVGGVPHTVVG